MEKIMKLKKHPQLVKVSNIIGTGRFNDHYKLNQGFLKFSTLEEIHFNNFSADFLYTTTLVSNIETICFDGGIFRLESLGDTFELDKNGLYNEKYDLIKFKSIKKINLKVLDATLQNFYYLLFLSPNLKILNFGRFIVTNLDANINYELPAPFLLIITNIIEIDETTCNEIKIIPMLNWLKLY